MSKLVALIGGGVIGSGWAARCLAKGLDVIATDPAPSAEERMRAAIENAWPALSRIGLAQGASLNRFHFVNTIEECVAEADFIQENAPEREDLKIHLHAQISKAAPWDTIIASSSSGLLPTCIYSKAKNPGRCLIAHPFNPVYLLPLVELVGGEHTGQSTLDRASDFYRSLGMRPLHVRKEIDGYIADRLLEALWREALHLVNDGVATTAEIDDAIRFGPGLRWSFWGTNLIYHLAGGEEGMRHMLEQFGPALELPWTHLKAPELTQELIEKMVSGTKEQAKGKPIKELERFRDDCLIEVQEAVKRVKSKYGLAWDE